MKNDERDARDLADLLRLGRLAEAWTAPSATRELRELVRFRYKLCNLRTGIKARAHAVMAENGVLPVRRTGPSTRCARTTPAAAPIHREPDDALTEKFHAIAERPGRTRANVAIARKALTLVYYGLRDGEIRCLPNTKAA